LPRARDAALVKVAFAVRYYADRLLLRATLSKAFAKGKGFFAERIRPSAKNLVPVVVVQTVWMGIERVRERQMLASC